jgi:AraC-like DNA-binding protein
MSNYAQTAGYTWDMLRCYGVDPEPLFAAAGITRDDIRNPAGRIPRDRLMQVKEQALELVRDEAFGVRYTEVFHPSHLGPLGYAWLSSSTLRSALSKLQRYSRLISQTFVAAISEAQDESIIGFYWVEDDAGPPPEHFGTVAVMVRMCRLIAGPDFKPIRVEFRPGQPNDLEPFEAHFRCPMLFGQRLDSLVIPRALMDQPLPYAHPELSQLHENMIVRYLADQDRGDIVSQVRAAISDLLVEGNVTADKVSGQLNMTGRTLRRRLHDKGVSFRELLGDQRREAGLQYIRNRGLSLTEISYLLGFSSPAAFSRAFKVWTGMSPAMARKG